MARRYITTAIPHVNSRPHLGFATELVQADVMARRNSLENAIAAEAEGMPASEPTDRNAAVFHGLRGPLQK
jgi:methionyl-tRNA synthetase